MNAKAIIVFISVSTLVAPFIFSGNVSAGPLFDRRGADPASDVEVKIEKSQSANFSGYKTYNWVPGVEKRTLDPRLRDSELDQRVREYVDRELQARGYQKTNFAEPDFWVGYYAVIESGVDTQTIRTNIGGPTGRDVMRNQGWPRESEVTLSRSYDQGMLVLDVIDAQGNKLVWRASAKAEVHQKVDIVTRRARLSGAITKMMGSLPAFQNGSMNDEVNRIKEQQEMMRETFEERRDSRV